MSFTAAQADAEEARRRSSAARAQPASTEERKGLLAADGNAADGANRNGNGNAARAGGGGANGNANGNANPPAAGGGGVMHRIVTAQQARELSACWDAIGSWVIMICVIWGLVAIMWLCVYAYELHMYMEWKDLLTEPPAGTTVMPRDGGYCEKRLALWLGVDGGTGLWFLFVIGILGVVLYFYILRVIAIARDDNHRNDNERQNAMAILAPNVFGLIIVVVFVWLTSLFRVIWSIIGSVWVFTIPKSSDDRACPDGLYKFHWLRAVLGWAWIGVMIVLICVSVCTLFCMIKSPANGANPADPNAPNAAGAANAAGANANANGNANANANANARAAVGADAV